MRFDFLLIYYYGVARIRAIFFCLLTGIRFKSVGVNLKIFGAPFMRIGRDFSLGDGCWLHAVSKYKEFSYAPLLIIGDGVSFSDAVHVSCVSEVRIGSGTLVGSRVYIGDHCHGSTDLDRENLLTPPAQRPLSDAAPIFIGDNVWIGDGVVILAGSVIPSGSIIGANSVVKGCFSVAGVIAGCPATLKREF